MGVGVAAAALKRDCISFTASCVRGPAIVCANKSCTCLSASRDSVSPTRGSGGTGVAVGLIVVVGNVATAYGFNVVLTGITAGPGVTSYGYIGT